MDSQFPERLNKAVASIQRQISFRPQIALAIGTGLKGLIDEIDVEKRIPYAQIEGFPVSTAPSHIGEFVFGSLHGAKIMVQNGRFHRYEGWHDEDVVLPVYTMRNLGAAHFVVTNAAGALNTKFKVAEPMLIEDHLNFQGTHPLTGSNDEKLGPRFPDLSDAYHKPSRSAAIRAADELGIILQKGIYAAVHGPEFETSAERRFLSMAGGDAVGMSTVAEVIAANHCGMKVLGISAITNAAAGGEDQEPDTIGEVIENADIAAQKIRKIILAMITSGDFSGDAS